MTAGAGAPAHPSDVKCVVWDLDGTLLTGTLLETTASHEATPTVRPGVRDILACLHERGIVNSIASRNPPRLAATTVRAVEWPAPFVAPQYGWGAKSDSIRRIADALHIHLDALAFVDDDPYERAEVAAALPQVVVLSPDEIGQALAWPQFRPAVVTDEARGRAQSYLDARRRQLAERRLGGSRADFRGYCRTSVTVRRARAADLPRLVELSARTSRFNSRGAAVPEPAFIRYLASDGHRTACVELRDRFGDDGVVGAAVVAAGPHSWDAELVMMSCRAIGRSVIEALLTCVGQAAHRAGAAHLHVPVRANERNVPLRLALLAAGFRARSGEPGQPVLFGQAVGLTGGQFPVGITVVDEL